MLDNSVIESEPVDLTCAVADHLWHVAEMFRKGGDPDAYGVMMVALTVVMYEVTGIPLEEISENELMFWIRWVTGKGTVQ